MELEGGFTRTPSQAARLGLRQILAADVCLLTSHAG
jgi:hypothetical protein